MTERAHPDLWLEPEDDPRTQAAPVRGERETVLGYLRHFRLTFALKCEGLSDVQLATRSVPPSSMSLLGLVRHLARVDHHWNLRALQGHEDIPRLYRTEDQPDLDFDGVPADPTAVEPAVVAQAWADWHRESAAAEAWLAADDFDRVFDYRGEPTEVRDIAVHLVEEYARHCGHADLLRECLDGRTGQ